jgi:hypothetical protein
MVFEPRMFTKLGRESKSLYALLGIKAPGLLYFSRSGSILRAWIWPKY